MNVRLPCSLRPLNFPETEVAETMVNSLVLSET